VRTLLRLLCLTGLAALPVVVHAAEKPEAGAHMPSMGDLLKASGVSFGGYIDTSYDYLDGDGAFTSGVANRVFEGDPSGFNLHQAALILAKQPGEGVGGLVNITAGSDADIIAAAGTGGAIYAGDDNFDVTQAFLQYATGGLTVMAGKFVTMSGAEVINSTANANASRGILFGYAIPFGHTGVRTSYKVNDNLTLVAGLNNGWDQQSDGDDQKTGELCALITAGSVALGAVAYVGQEVVAPGVTDDRTLVDVVASFTAGMATVVLNADIGEQKNTDGLDIGTDASWSGVAGYLNLKFSDTFAASLRAEYFDDEDGYRTGVVQKWKEVTLTTNFTIDNNLSVMPEIRLDSSDQDSFSTKGGTEVEDSQLGAMVKAVYKF